MVCQLLEERKKWAPSIRGVKIGPTRWASPVHSELRPGWAIKLLARKKLGQIWPCPIWPSLVCPYSARPVRIFFVFKRLFGPASPVFRAGWVAKILVRKIWANFGPKNPGQFWPCPVLAQPTVDPAQPDPANPDCQLYPQLVLVRVSPPS